MSEDVERPPRRRRPGRLRRWVVRPMIWGLLLVIAALAGLLLFSRSRYARHELAARMVAAISAKIGRRVQVADLDFTFLPPAVELRGVVVPGPHPADPPVATAELLRLQATWLDLRRSVLRLEQVEAIHPHVLLQWNADGTSNLPSWKSEGTPGPQQFEVEIGRVLVQDGTFSVNQMQVPLTVDARAVWGRLSGKAERHGRGGERLDAMITAQEVVTALPNALPYPATVSVKASLDPGEQRLRIATGRVAGPDMQLQTAGEIEWKGGRRRIALHVDGKGSTRFVNRLGYLREPIDGAVDLHGQVDVIDGAVRYRGTVTSPQVAIAHRLFRDVAVRFDGGRDGLKADVERAAYAEGRASGTVRVDWVEKQRRGGVPVTLDLALAGLALQPLVHDLFPGQSLAVVDGLGGAVRGRLRFRFLGGAELRGDGDADLQVDAVERGTGLPIAGAVPLAIHRGVLSADPVHLTAPGQSLEIDGFSFDLQKVAGRFTYRLDSRDLARVTPLLRLGEPPGAPPPFWLPTAGQGVVAGEVTIDRDQFAARIDLDLSRVVAPITAEAPSDTVRGTLTVRPAAVDDLRLGFTKGGAALEVAGRVPLAPAGAARAAAPITLTVDAHGWPAPAIAAFVFPPAMASALATEGGVTGHLDLAGFSDLLTGRAGFTIDRFALAGIGLGQLRGSVAFEGGRIRVEQALVATPAGNVVVAGTFDGTPGQEGGGRLDFTLDAPALALAADPFRARLGGRLDGRMSVAAVVGGTLDRPEATVRVLGSGLALAGRPLAGDGAGAGGTAGQPGTAMALLAWDGKSLRATGSLLGLVAFDGGGRLDAERADLAFDVRSDALGALARLTAPHPVPDFKGSFAGTLGVTADFARKESHGELRLTDLRAQFRDHAVANVEPVVVDFLPDRVAIRTFYVGEKRTGSELFASGTIGLGDKVPLDLHVQSTLTAAWAELFVPSLQVEGFLDVLATVRGTADDPVLSGQGEIRQARLVLPNFPHAIENLNGAISFSRNGIEIDGMRADLGGGKLQASGRIGLPRPGEDFSYRFQVAANDISLRYPEGFLARGDADLALVSTPQSRVIRGDVRLERLFYLEDVRVNTFDLLRRVLQRQRLQVAQTDPFLTSTQLNVQVSGAEALRVNNNLAKLRGAIDLSVQGTLANPVLFGRVELEPGGTLLYADNSYEIERGLLTFKNPDRIDPVIDLVARTEVRRFGISLSLSGTLDRLSAKFSSDEGLSDLEVLTLLSGGGDPEAQGRILAPGERSPQEDVGASTFLAGQAASMVSERVGSLFGFDRFRIDPLASTGGSIGGVRVTVGKRISKNLFVTYSSNPSAADEYLVRAEWQVAENLMLIFTRDGKADNYAVDAEWERRF